MSKQFANKMIELAHNDEIRRSPDNRLELLVVQYRHRVLPRGVPHPLVNVPHRLGAQVRIGLVLRIRGRERPAESNRVLERLPIFIGKHPPAVLVVGILRPRPLPHGHDDRHAYRFLEALEGARQEGAVGPRAGVRDVEVVSARFGRELGPLLAADGVPEGGVGALEGAVASELYCTERWEGDECQ